ncbi:adenine deaminase C-terminal domain-containing protein [Desulfobacterales bacterium HSG2]|nr:adenine deaminase C-terminal domain-containing protein [Desulfobacterales bacterium HSG2]
MPTAIYESPDSGNSEELINVALGQEKADLAVISARVLNVYTGELLDDCSISIKGKRIAYVGTDPGDTIGEKTVVIDARGKTVIPGLIDGHTHIASISDIGEFLKYAMKGGTTTMITETMEAFAVRGYEGVTDFLAALKDQPVKILGVAPAMVSISKTAFGISRETLGKLLDRDDIVGLGESYWQAVFQEPDRMLPIFQDTLASGKTLEGHSAGAGGKKLAAYAATGISSCHEPINAEQVLERLRLGIHVMAREGSIRRDLGEISEIKEMGADLRRLTLVTDGVSPGELMEKGYMEFVVQKAIDSGFDPVTAVQMATLNVAEHFSLDGRIGGIAPGRYADMLIIPNIRNIKAEYVISNGQIICREGELMVSPRRHTFSEESLTSIRLPDKLKPSDFSVRTKDGSPEAEVRIIEMVTDLVTKELRMRLPVIKGEIRADVHQDILKIAAIDRTHRPGKTFVGLIKGFRMRAGAIASSAAWDTSDIVVAGADDSDMVLAVNRIHDLQGGFVVCAGGKVLAELPLPVLGLISDMPTETVAQRIEDIRKAAFDLGVPFPDPLLTLATLTCAAIPYLRICEEGLVNLRDGKTLGLFVSDPVP